MDIDWQAFCATERGNYNLTSPRIVDGRKIASDSRVMISHPTDEHPVDIEGRFPSNWKMYTEGSVDVWYPWPPPCGSCGWTGSVAVGESKCSACHARGWMRCEDCEGRSFVTCNYGCVHDCVVCQGSGRMNCRNCNAVGVVPARNEKCLECGGKTIVIGGRAIERHYALIISRLSPEWGVTSDEKDQPLLFRFGQGGRGAIMPVVNGDV